MNQFQLGVRHTFYSTSLRTDITSRRELRLEERSQMRVAMLGGLSNLLLQPGFPIEYAEDIHLLHDTLGKPYLRLTGAAADWANKHHIEEEYLHLSLSHDGNLAGALVAYAPNLVGIGVDMVFLPRFLHKGQNADYLRRFARRIMGDVEWEAFQTASTNDDVEALALRVASHFSLMEALSKACGTGLKMGLGLGKMTSLPMHSLGALSVRDEIRLFFGIDAQERLTTLGGRHTQADIQITHDFVISTAAIFR